jgi:hypothetical protein
VRTDQLTKVAPIRVRLLRDDVEVYDMDWGITYCGNSYAVMAAHLAIQNALLRLPIMSSRVTAQAIANVIGSLVCTVVSRLRDDLGRDHFGGCTFLLAGYCPQRDRVVLFEGNDTDPVPYALPNFYIPAFIGHHVDEVNLEYKRVGDVKLCLRWAADNFDTISHKLQGGTFVKNNFVLHRVAMGSYECPVSGTDLANTIASGEEDLQVDPSRDPIL